MTLPHLTPAKDLAERLRRKPRGPLRRLAAFAAGGDKVLVDAVPTELLELEVLGAAILFTTATAIAAGTLAAGFVAYGAARLTLGTLTFGAIYGLMIFAVDRTIARSNLNPFEYPKEALDALWNPTSDSQWFGVLTDTLHRPGFGSRVRQTWRVLAGAAVRILIAVCTSFLFAQFIAFYAFAPEIKTRMHYISHELVTQEKAKLRQDYRQALRANEAAQAKLLAVGDPRFQRRTSDIASLRQQAENAASDAVTYSLMEGKEIDGVRASARLSDGRVIRTTGKATPGSVSGTFHTAALAAQAHAGDLRAQIRGLMGEQRRLGARVAAHNSGSLKQLNAERRAAATRLTEDLRRVDRDVSDKGLLVRRDALNQLVADEHPETSAPDHYPGCRPGSFTWLCDVKNWAFPPTPLGPVVRAVMLMLFLIEILPVTLKMRMSLRRRRPYDAVRAALEEASSADALDMLDTALNMTGSDLERRASMRKADRSGSGAEHLLRRQQREDERRRRLAQSANDLERRLREPQRTRDPFRERWMRQVAAARDRYRRRRAARAARAAAGAHPPGPPVPRPAHGPAVVYVTAVHMDGGTTQEHVLEVQWRNPANGRRGRDAVQDVVAWIRDGGEVRVRDVTGHDAELVVVDEDPPYLSASAEGTLIDPLLRLPRY